MAKRGDPLMVKVCKRHKPKSAALGGPLGYIENHDWQQAQLKAGKKQTCCPKCGRWYFPSEKP